MEPSAPGGFLLVAALPSRPRSLFARGFEPGPIADRSVISTLRRDIVYRVVVLATSHPRRRRGDEAGDECERERLRQPGVKRGGDEAREEGAASQVGDFRPRKVQQRRPEERVNR